MTTVLIVLTLVVTAVVVVVLAVSLVLIALALVRANRNLARLVGGLEAIRDNTAPLGQDLAAINGAALTLRDRLLGVDGNLQGIIRLVRG